MTFHPTASTFKQGVKTLEARYYTAPMLFDRETERIFMREWLCTGHVSRIPKPGDYFVFNFLNESVIILHDRKGSIRALHNVCAHKGTRICTAEGGQFKSSIQCRYHTWTYDLGGNLLQARNMDKVAGFKKSENGLKPVSLHIWEGFIFVNFSPKPPAFAEQYPMLKKRFAKWNLSLLKPFHTEKVIANANWKLIFLNFSECLHCPTIHPTLNQVIKFDAGQNDLVEGAVLGGYLDIVKGDSLTTSGAYCGNPLGDLGDDKSRGYFYTIAPNLLLNILPEYVMFHKLTPVAAGQTQIETTWLFHPKSWQNPNFKPQEAVDFWMRVNQEDWSICEDNQLGIGSSAYQPGFYTAAESLLQAFDAHYLTLMGEGTSWIDR